MKKERPSATIMCLCANQLHQVNVSAFCKVGGQKQLFSFFENDMNHPVLLACCQR